MDSYFDFKLDKKFNDKQKDNIKLVLISQISNQINSIWEKNFTEKINTLLKNIPKLLKDKKDNEIKKVFLALWLPNLQKDIDKNISNINKEKNGKNFNLLKTSFSSIWLKEKDFNSIQWDITKTDTNFRKLSEKADWLKEIAEDIWMWKKLEGILEYIEKEWPFLWKLIAMIFWISKNISNNWKKTKKSV
jgi:intracellular sulfur oxidation DsrE/DsrF family protein